MFWLSVKKTIISTKYSKTWHPSFNLYYERIRGIGMLYTCRFSEHWAAWCTLNLSICIWEFGRRGTAAVMERRKESERVKKKRRKQGPLSFQLRRLGSVHPDRDEHRAGKEKWKRGQEGGGKELEKRTSEVRIGKWYKTNAWAGRKLKEAHWIRENANDLTKKECNIHWNPCMFKIPKFPMKIIDMVLPV